MRQLNKKREYNLQIRGTIVKADALQWEVIMDKNSLLSAAALFSGQLCGSRIGAE
jgi:hypothetical protein